jgi:hypothetical protein
MGDWFFGCLDRAFDGAEKILATVLSGEAMADIPRLRVLLHGAEN